MPPVAPVIALQMQFAGSAGAWTDVAADLRYEPSPRAHYGIPGAGPQDRVADVGTFSFALDNSERNSAALVGYYSPGHANARVGFDVGIGVRLALTYSGSTFYKFRGTLDEIVPQGGKNGRKLTQCAAVDWMDEAVRRKTERIATQFDQRGNQLIATMVAAMTRKPAASSLATGQDRFPFAFDNTPDETTSVMRMFQLIAQAELGFIYLKGDTATGGVLTFQDRHARPQSGSAVVTLDETMVALTPRRARDKVFNRVRVSVHPRRTDASACILYNLRGAPLVRAGQTRELAGFYVDRVPGASATDSRIGAFTTCTLVQTTDYLFNSASNGTGANLTANLTVGASFGANAHFISLTNTGGTDGYVTYLQVRGRGLYDYEPLTLEARDANSSGCYGDSVLEYDMKLQNSDTIGQDAADYLLSVWKDPVTRIETVEFVANGSDDLMLAALRREISDRITVAETVSGVNRDYFIQAVNLQLLEKNRLVVGWTVMPTDPYQAWTIGVVGSTELGQTTILGY